jgi:hypothetical protein
VQKREVTEGEVTLDLTKSTTTHEQRGNRNAVASTTSPFQCNNNRYNNLVQKREVTEGETLDLTKSTTTHEQRNAARFWT